MNNLETKIEGKAMILGFFINLIMGIAGWYMYLTTNLDALFLDGNFSLISALSCLFAIFITKYSNKQNETFPDGMNFLEPLYGLIKSSLSIYLMVSAGFSAIDKLFLYLKYNKGELIKSGYIFQYSIAMVILCFGLAYVFIYYNKKIYENSIILKVESKASFVDGIISLGVGLAILLVTFIPKDGNLIFIHYTADSFITIFLILFSYKGPFTAFFDSFIELTKGRARSKHILSTIEEIVQYEDEIEDRILVRETKIYKVGKKIYVEVYLDSKSEFSSINDVIKVKEKIYNKLKLKYNFIELSMII